MKIRLSIAAVGLILLFQRPAHAYIDPGTASIILQAVVGAVAAAGLFFRSHLGRLWSFVRRRAARDETPNVTSNDGRAPRNAPDDR